MRLSNGLKGLIGWLSKGLGAVSKTMSTCKNAPAFTAIAGKTGCK